MVVNPSGRTERFAHALPELANAKAVLGSGVSVTATAMTAVPFGFAIFAIT